MAYMASGMMARPEKILGLVLAGGQGLRMQPLTQDQAKPALPVGGCFRLVDFVLSNLINSGIECIYLLAQYKPESLIEHIYTNWRLTAVDEGHFISVVLPRREQGGYFHGTADAVYQNLALIEQHAPDLVAVFAADHIYRMDVRQMAYFHRECDADVTVAATQVPIEQASSFGIIAAGYRGEIFDIQQAPEAPIAIPACPDRAYALMGDYLFSTDVLVEALEQALRVGETDFGVHILPRLLSSHHVHAYDLSSNCIPGIRAHEEPSYWRDIGTMEEYISAHQDICGNAPRFNLHNPHWPIQPLLCAQQSAFDMGYVQAVSLMNGSDMAVQYPISSVFSAECDARQIGSA